MSNDNPVCVLCNRSTGPGSWCNVCKAHLCWKHEAPNSPDHTRESHVRKTHTSEGVPLPPPKEYRHTYSLGVK